MKKRKKIISVLLCFALAIMPIVQGSQLQVQAKKKIRLNRKKVTLYIGKKTKLKVKGTPKKVVWKSQKKKIATVTKKGVVKAKKKGKVKIIAKTAGKKLVCKVTVKKKPKKTAKPTAKVTRKPTPKPTDTATATPNPNQGEPVFSKESGSYKDAFDLTLSAPKGSTIYYTTDGSVPGYEDDKKESVKEGLPFVLSADKEEFGSAEVTTSYGMDGVNISFAKRYSSICYKAPEGVTDWSGYDSIAIEYTVNQVGNGGNTLGLQVVPIYADAESSWNGSDGQSDTTRIHETRLSLDKVHSVAKISLKDGSDYSSVGRLMLGVYNEGTYSENDSITIHAIHLLKENEKYEIAQTGGERFPAKLPTNEYTGPISIKNNDSAVNRLCSEANIPFMYDPYEGSYNGAFYPELSAVPKATIIRAMAVDAEGNKSKVVTKVYFVDKDLQTIYKNASVISVVTDPDNLLSADTGIETTMGLRIHGNYTRRWGQKSLRLYFREELGMKNLKGYQLIPDAVNADGTPTKKYKRFILRNGGNEYAYSKMQDVFIQKMVSDRAFTTQSARPCVLFLNGEYWGLYNLTERYSDNYLEEEFGVDKENVVVIKCKELDEGREEDFALYEELAAMAELDMSVPGNYEKFKEMVDIQSFMDYYATGIYIGNDDWPHNNTQLWRTRVNDGTKYGDTKWRYMLYDTEYSMNLWGCDSEGTVNRIAIAMSEDELFGALCKNREFCQAFADTLMDICRNNFNVTKATAELDKMAAIYRPLMEQYKARFGNGDVDSRVNGMKSYIAGRESQLKGFIEDSLGITVE